MNDQLIMDNYLLVLKSTVEVFVHGTLESSNNSARKLLKTGLFDIMSAQARTYDEMTKNGWYQINNVKAAVVNNTYKNIIKKNQ